MSVIQIDRNPSRRTLNQFGFIWLGFLALFGVISWFKLPAHTTAIVLWIAAAVVPLVGWVFPSFMRLVFLGMSYAAWPIGFVVSHVILAVVYYLVFTPVGLMMRLLGHDPMMRRADSQAASYWIAREPAPPDRKRYFRQF